MSIFKSIGRSLAKPLTERLRTLRIKIGQLEDDFEGLERRLGEISLQTNHVPVLDLKVRELSLQTNHVPVLDLKVRELRIEERLIALRVKNLERRLVEMSLQTNQVPILDEKIRKIESLNLESVKSEVDSNAAVVNGWQQHIPAFLNAVTSVNAFGHELLQQRKKHDMAIAALRHSLHAETQPIAAMQKESAQLKVLIELANPKLNTLEQLLSKLGDELAQLKGSLADQRISN